MCGGSSPAPAQQQPTPPPPSQSQAIANKQAVALSGAINQDQLAKFYNTPANDGPVADPLGDEKKQRTILGS